MAPEAGTIADHHHKFQSIEMPTDTNEIMDRARDYAEGTELAAALEAGAPIEAMRDVTRTSWVRRWLDLSDWARHRELRALERNLVESIEDLRHANEVARERAIEALRCSVWTDGFFDSIVRSNDPEGVSEVSRRWTETRFYREDALNALNVAAEASKAYLEARSTVDLAKARSQSARRHFAEVRRVRSRATALGFLLSLVLIGAAALLLHYRFHTP